MIKPDRVRSSLLVVGNRKEADTHDCIRDLELMRNKDGQGRLQTVQWRDL